MLPGDFNKIRFRSLSFSNRNESIQKNLQTLKENTMKKTMAQNLYYEKHCKGRSPLLRDVRNKLPIHQRLGKRSISKRKVPLLGTSTNTLVPRRDRRRNWGRFSVQHRIDAIRQRQREMLTRLRTPSNVPSYKIQVFNNPEASNDQRFRMQLDYQIQMEIKQIQNAYPRDIFHGLYPISPVATNIPLNFRFSTLI